MAVSSPGKVLMMGGYAVLEYHPAYSIAVESREGLGVVAESQIGERRVVSEEFGMDLSPSEPNSPVEAAYLVAESYLRKYGGQETTVRLKNSEIFGRADEKSGLGSSSASIVATIAGMFEANGFDIYEHRGTIHLLGQVANALHSGKVGSGYDIASATYGSIEYRRFSPSVLEAASLDNIEKILKGDWRPLYVRQVAPPWGLAVFNIKRGKTSTISSVKAFRKAQEMYGKEVKEALSQQAEAEREARRWMEVKEAGKFREALHRARAAHRKLSELMRRVEPGVDEIEPEPLRRVIERSESIEGVVAGRCHGGGGWDGLAFFVEEGFNSQEVVSIGKEEGIELCYIPTKVNEDGVKDVEREGFW